jgi:hypothetical protein
LGHCAKAYDFHNFQVGFYKKSSQICLVEPIQFIFGIIEDIPNMNTCTKNWSSSNFFSTTFWLLFPTYPKQMKLKKSNLHFVTIFYNFSGFGNNVLTKSFCNWLKKQLSNLYAKIWTLRTKNKVTRAFQNQLTKKRFPLCQRDLTLKNKIALTSSP